MSQVDFKTDELIPCQCGFKPDHYSIGYGRTPYDIYCPNCKKQSQFAKCQVTGSHYNLIDYWNKHVAGLTLEQMQQEVRDLNEEKKREDPYKEYKVYTYYWYEGKGAVLTKQC